MVASIHLMYHTDSVGKPQTAFLPAAFNQPRGLIRLNQAILAFTVCLGAHVNLKHTTQLVSVWCKG